MDNTKSIMGKNIFLEYTNLFYIEILKGAYIHIYTSIYCVLTIQTNKKLQN